MKPRKSKSNPNETFVAIVAPPPQGRRSAKTMKKEDFIRKQKEAKRLVNRVLACYLCFLVVLTVIVGCLRSLQRTWIDTMGMVVGVVAAFAGILWVGRMTDLSCPACGHDMRGRSQAGWVLSTGKCRYCQVQIIDDLHAEPTPPSGDSRTRRT